MGCRSPSEPMVAKRMRLGRLDMWFQYRLFAQVYLPESGWNQINERIRRKCLTGKYGRTSLVAIGEQMANIKSAFLFSILPSDSTEQAGPELKGIARLASISVDAGQS